MDNNFQHFVEWCFYGVLGGASVYAVSILGSMKDSIDKLNEKIAVIIEKTQWHEKELERHNYRISNLEKKDN